MTFSGQFISNQGKAIVVAGREVVPALRYEVREGDRARIILRRSIRVPVQGVCLTLKGGTFEVTGQHLKQPVIWRDTAPDETVFTCKTKKPARLLVWNCWRDDPGVKSAWGGNAGMRTTVSKEQRITVECNSRSEITFEDLVFDLVIESATC